MLYNARPLRRTLYANAKPSALGQPFTATIAEPIPAGLVWVIDHVTLEIPNYVSGAVTAVLSIGPPGNPQRFAGTNQGQFDTLGPVGRWVHQGEQITVTWNPTRVVGFVQGRVTVNVRQGRPELVGP